MVQVDPVGLLSLVPQHNPRCGQVLRSLGITDAIRTAAHIVGFGNFTAAQKPPRSAVAGVGPAVQVRHANWLAKPRHSYKGFIPRRWFSPLPQWGNGGRDWTGVPRRMSTPLSDKRLPGRFTYSC